ncbi:syntaxin 17 [Nasonia vitripennis]|uniref:t-SNARE coiled-coil homology domain-containing protein n=1 Tax=Nasonia vitripennis TaxID=7425 RepID=A0A7M6UFE1_NASVI|nr:syntaxin 17 [Nasonia vitripennis]
MDLRKIDTMSSSLDSEDVKQPIKRLEIPISKFNDVAIPHHLDLLKRHKNNIKKSQGLRDWDRVYTEQINASRIVKQLKQLLHEMDTLRGQVQDSDIATFDKLTMKARTSTLNAIKEYLEFELNLPLVKKHLTQVSDDHQNTEENPLDNRFMQIQAEEEELERQQACLQAWTSLHNDLEELQKLFIDFNQIVHEQAESVDRIENNVEDVQVNVASGTRSLQQASKYKVMAYPIAGALLGTCLGGPVGLLAGFKFGGLTAIGGGLLGFTGGAILKKKCHIDTNLKQIEGPTELRRKPSTSSQELNKFESKKDS